MAKGSRYFSFLLIILSLACAKVDVDAIDNLQEGKIIRIGHGGSGFTSLFPFNALPTNSIAAFKEALEEKNADGVEMDVHMTADFEFILYHDKNLETKTAEKGYPEELNLDDMLGIPYEEGFPYDLFQDESLVSLDSAINYFHTLSDFPLIHIDLRHYCICFTSEENHSWGEKMLEQLFQKLEQLNVPKNRVRIISVSKPIILFAKDLPNSYPVSFEVHEFDEDLAWAISNQIDCITANKSKLTIEGSKLAHENGIEVITFFAKSDAGNLEMIEKNPDYIQTDNLSSLNDLLKE